ncbi:hypothetical protein CLV36_11324 [Laceyella sediminis]|uniref:Uncharacterized protein n=1 Tax=Laceyella sediminis TaxID=573074 RepID=A0ABX5ELT7_9BACL|nr:hypothetical protein CLV36_11324 [Laceyella sediminis]
MSAKQYMVDGGAVNQGAGIGLSIVSLMLRVDGAEPAFFHCPSLTLARFFNATYPTATAISVSVTCTTFCSMWMRP